MKSTRSLRRQLRALWVTHLVLFAALCIAATPAVRPLLLDTSNHPTANVDFTSSHWTGDPTGGKAIAPASVTTPVLNSSTNTITLLPGSAQPVTFHYDGTFSSVRASAFTGTTGGSAFNFTSTYVFLGPYGLDLQNQPLLFSSAGIGPADAGLVSAGPAQLHLTNGGTGDGSLTLGSLTASGPISFDGGAGYSDGLGGLTLTGYLSTSGGGYLTQTGGGGLIDTSNSGGSISTSYGGGYIHTNENSSPADTSAPVGSLWLDQQGHNGHVLWVMEPTGWAGK